MLIRMIVIVCVSVGLMSCISSPPPPDTFYYILDPKPTSFTAKKDTQAIKIASVNVPDYMKQPNLVLKLSDHQIKISNYHYWAEDIRQSTKRVLISDLNGLSTDLSFTDACTKCTEVKVTIDHFYATEAGDVVLAGTYQINDGFNSQSQYAYSFTNTLIKGGFDESVANMRLLVSDLAKHIQNRL